MSRLTTALNTFSLRARARLVALHRSRRARRVAVIVGILLTIYALLGFFAAPPLMHRWVDTHASALLGRPVSVGALHFNPFNLKLDADQLHVGEVDGHTPFVDIEHLTVNGSWSSLWRLAPVLDELTVLNPHVVIRRSAPQRFNFSDLVERFAGAPSEAGAEPARLSLSNIVVHGGDLRFADDVLNASHHIEDIEIGIPFIANLPHDVDVFVQPLLAMTVDGSPLRIEGQVKPFASSLESTLELHFDRLDLPRYLGYVPAPLPVAIPQGLLSGNLELRFVQSKAAPQLNVSGTLVVHDLVLTEIDRAPIAEVGLGVVGIVDAQPLISRFHLGGVRLDQTALHYVSRAPGHSNLDALIGNNAKPAVAGAAKKPPADIAIANLVLQASHFDYADTSDDAPATVAFDALDGSLADLDTLKGAATIEVSAQLNGGTLATNGKLDLAASQYTGQLKLKDVGLAPLQAVAAPDRVAVIQQGRFDADGHLQADWHGVFNLHVEPATLGLRDVAIGHRDSTQAQVSWHALDVALTHFDLATAEARLGTVALHGLTLSGQRARDGTFDLASLTGRTPNAKAISTTPAPAWRWSVEHFAFDDGALNVTDLSSPKPAELAVTALKGEVGGLSGDLQQPLKLVLSGAIEKGNFDMDGQIQPEPLKAELTIKTRALELSGLQSYVTVPLNVSVTRAQLTSDGQLQFASGVPLKLTYAGRASLGQVRVRDKLSDDDFLTLRALNFASVDVKLDGGPPHVTLGDVVLDDFYARVIINANGRLNLADVAGSAAAEPVSVTRPDTAATPAPAAPAKAKIEAPAGAPANAPAAFIHVGAITLTRGRLTFTDNFIKPNYTANITALTGKIGAIGTNAAPAPVTLQGKLDENAPVNIDGTINPLATAASVDITGKAIGVELTNLSAYSSAYTGYPIEKGRLNGDVHYVLDQRKLTGDNHLVIEQLTFGDRIESPGASHLPVKLAVALLKNARGEIDVNVPVSGSLEDPQFSLGGLIGRALGGLIGKAATAPFRLLASMFGGGREDLGYVEFAPGMAVLDAAGNAKLAQIVAAFADRPSLNLDIIGRVDPATDEAGLRAVIVDALIRKEWADDKGDKTKGDTTSDASSAPAAPLTPEQTERYLERAYKHATFARERNLLGMIKSQPPDVMRQLLETNMPVDENALRQLAQSRADAVHDFLQGKIDDKRLFLVAPKLDAKGIEDHGATTRVDFSLHE